MQKDIEEFREDTEDIDVKIEDNTFTNPCLGSLRDGYDSLPLTMETQGPSNGNGYFYLC